MYHCPNYGGHDTCHKFCGDKNHAFNPVPIGLFTCRADIKLITQQFVDK